MALRSFQSSMGCLLSMVRPYLGPHPLLNGHETTDTEMVRIHRGIHPGFLNTLRVHILYTMRSGCQMASSSSGVPVAFHNVAKEELPQYIQTVTDKFYPRSILVSYLCV